MNKNYKNSENFKILEFSDHAEILPINNKYTTCMFFFAGFNENASKYIYLLKIFIENFDQPPKLKIIIPYLPIYTTEEYPTFFISNPAKFTSLYAWYSFEKIDLPQGGFTYKFIPNKGINENIIKMVSSEIEKLDNNSENIIFAGFSMGGRYLLEILTMMKIKTKFNMVFKSVLLLYNNPYKNSVNEDDKAFNNNEFYLYFSIYDKIVTFNRGLESIQFMKKNGFKNLKVKIDNNRKHIVDNNCLNYLQQQYIEKCGKSGKKMTAKF